jgi:hypothetical protein
MIISPPKVYEVNGQVTPVLSAPIQATVGSDRQIIAAISGKRIRFMGFMACAEDATTNFASLKFKNGSGGTAFTHTIPCWAFPTSPQAGLPIVDSGYFETTAGVGLYADIGAVTVNMTVFYIAYTP